MLDLDAKRTPAWVLHPEIKNDRDARPAEPALGEAVALAAALPGLDVRGSEIVRLGRVHPGMLFGSGKIEELKGRFKDAGVELVLVDGPVSPVQQRNLEKEWGVKLLDRTGVILEIFADRARTREGVLQVEMAALSYQRTRLVRSWTHLERQRGGFGFVGGPGETQIEADRRAIDDQLVKLRRQIDRVARTRTLHRAARAKVPFPVVALVGYTNAGKSTIFNRLTGAEVLAKDMLFATLDPTMRRVRLPSGLDVILSDTVGFISDLPTELVAAFRATLEEVLDADLILHVRDISHAQTDQQAEDVEAILQSLGVGEGTPLIEVWNKIDLLDPESRESVRVQGERVPQVFPVSATNGEGLDALLAEVSGRLDEPREEEEVVVPYAAGRQRAWLHENRLVVGEQDEEKGTRMRVRWTARQRDRYSTL
ncbi:GTPase HflX [Rubellimicrobium roseum]|uniref:GTPase HflX n=1 Tax=Rubellimicrobium roseum TaxID=687525 RepID=A0A5C4NB85_9RHOB|nr:GTPase HflX [Rubellimicrobium roseum]TNC71963.1 GTPase HflX [Rubellimicrobium roseum]